MSIAVKWICFVIAVAASLSVPAWAESTTSGKTRETPEAHLYADRPFRIGIIELSQIERIHNLVETSVDRLRKVFHPYQIDVKVYSSRELEKAIKSGEIDAFIASPGFFWRMVGYGAKDIATMVFPDRPDPNHSSAITYVTRADREDIKTLEDMRGLRLSVSYPTAFMGYRIGLAEIAAHGFDPDKFFSATSFTMGPAIEDIAQKVIDGSADVAFVQACWLESLSADYRKLFKVIAPIQDENFPCVRSTQTYPNITAAVLRGAPAPAAREIAKALLTMPPNEAGEHWGIATDFQSVDRVYRLLRIENYAYMREWSVQRWISAHKHWIVMALFCLILLCGHSFVVSYLVRRKTEQLAAANKEKEAANRRMEHLYARMENIRKANIISQLSSMIVHELAQPVGAAQSFCKGLHLRLDNGTLTDDALQKSLQGIERGLGRIRRIVDRVRSYHKGASDRNTTLDLLETIKTAYESLPGQLRSIGKIKIDVGQGIRIKGDQLEIELLFNNLLSNAVKAASETDSPVISIESQDDKDESGRVTVSIENAGRFFTSDDIEQMSVPFVSENGPGHGLGVPIALSLAEANGGKLSFFARKSGGLTAVVELRKAIEIPTNKSSSEHFDKSSES